jgi:hypothetical protein
MTLSSQLTETDHGFRSWTVGVLGSELRWEQALIERDLAKTSKAWPKLERGGPRQKHPAHRSAEVEMKKALTA